MHNPPPQPPPPLPPSPPPQGPAQFSEIDSISIQLFNDEDEVPSSSASLWDWNDFLNFDQLTTTLPSISDQPPVPSSVPPPAIISEPPPAIISEPDGYGSNTSDKVRKRDPRLVCSNFLAGRVPCACPEMDALLAEEEEVVPGKKRARIVRTGPGGFQCQVPGCGVDISELKGYHRRHRVCLGCANASSVFIDGETKRYCQQCGKFHILPDFDEGKRSCRRKLERHNNRRRRKSTESKDPTEREAQQVLSTEDVGCDDETEKDTVSLSNQGVEREDQGADRSASILCSAPGSQNLQSDSGVSLATSGETLCDEEKDKSNQSPSYYDNKNAFPSVCPTGRISFKLYDWNPAEFPRRLRHQIFQWLANMPVELEGYVRPGCTILTVFIAMPTSMWVKLSGDPLVYIRHLVAPGKMLSGRGTFYVYLNNLLFRVLKDGTSVVKVQTRKKAPKLHYVHPTCFEAGKPMEFLVCGSNLLQPNFRFLVSFAGEYLSYDDFSVSSLNHSEEHTSKTSDHQLLKICVPRSESNLSGSAFVEVENESGVSNFISILIGDEKICSEIIIMQHKLDTSLHLKGSQFASTSSSSSCEVSVSRQKYFSEFVQDVAWLLKVPALENKQQILTSMHLQRFNGLLSFLIKNQSLFVLERVASNVKMIMKNSLTTGVDDADIRLCKMNIDHAYAVLCQKLQSKVNLALPVLDLVTKEDYLEQSTNIDMFAVVPLTNQDIEKNELGNFKAPTSVDRSETAPLLNAKAVTSVNHLIEQPRKPYNRLITNIVLPPRTLIFLISIVTVCLGICSIVLHPQNAGGIAVTIRRCLFNLS